MKPHTLFLHNDQAGAECAGSENRKVPPPSIDPADCYEFDAKNLACFVALLDQNADLGELATLDLPDVLRAGIMTRWIRSAHGGHHASKAPGALNAQVH